MRNKYKMDKFQVDTFRPTKLKEAREALEKHILRVQMHAHTNDEYKKGVLKEESLWQKLSGLFKR